MVLILNKGESMKNIFYASLILLIASAAVPENRFLRDDFNSMVRWEPLTFPKIKKHSSYTIVKENNRNILKAESAASASGLILKDKFNVYSYPAVKWRWKIENVYKKGNARLKSGDDYPIRVYIIFKYNPEKADFATRAKYNAVKLIYGEYPPHSSLNYIWANKKHSSSILTSPYTDRSKMIILQHGENRKGEWIEEDVNILNDYRKAFGEDPPETAGIAIMSDSDNTGESSAAYIDYIEIRKR